jgi:cell division septation protein DedD
MNKTARRPSFGSSGADSGTGDAEATLRLIAGLQPPEGVAERVQARLRAEASAPAHRARILAWPVAWRLDNIWLQGTLMRAAAAAAIVTVVVGGGLGIYSRVPPEQPARAVTIPPHVSAQGGFSSAGAIRTPQTLNGPIVAHPAAAATSPAKNSTRQTATRRAKPAKALARPVATAANTQGEVKTSR